MAGGWSRAPHRAALLENTPHNQVFVQLMKLKPFVSETNFLNNIAWFNFGYGPSAISVLRHSVPSSRPQSSLHIYSDFFMSSTWIE